MDMTGRWGDGNVWGPGAVPHPAPQPRPATMGASGQPPPGGNGSDPFFGAPADPTAWGTPQNNPFYNSGAHPGDTKYFNAGLGPDPGKTVRDWGGGIIQGIFAEAARLGLVALFGGAALAVLVLTLKPYLT